MKILTVITCLLFFLFLNKTHGQEKTIKLNLKEGYRYVFEKLEYNYIEAESGLIDTSLLRKKVIQCDVEKVIPDSQVIVRVSLKENNYKNPSTRGFYLNYDHFFPEYNNNNTFEDYFEELLCRINILYSLNLKTRKAVLLNKKELVDKCREIMLEKEHDALFAETIVNPIIYQKKIESAGLISYLLWFHNASFASNNQIKNSLLYGKPIVVEKSSGILQFTKEERNEIIRKGRIEKFRIDTISGMLQNYLTLWPNDPGIPNYSDMIRGRARYFRELRINLLSSGRIQPDLVLMEGNIEKPLSKKLYIRYLQKPFGDELQNKTVYLDDSGTFSTDFAFAHGGFIYVENDNPNKNNPPGTFVFYAEPGDSIRFQAKGEKLPWTVTYSGNRINENRLLYEIRSQIKIIDRMKDIKSWSNELLDRQLIYGYTIDYQHRKIVGSMGIGDLISKIEKSEKLIQNYKSLLNNNSYEFILNEFKSYFISGMYNFMQSSDIPFYKHLIDQTDKKEYLRITNYVENLDIQSLYNEYGLQSRRLITNYLTYNYDRNNKTKNYFRTGNAIRFSYNTDQLIQYARMILSGSPLYREIAFFLSGQYGYIPLSVDRNDSVIHRELIHRNFDLMLRKCNDNEFLNEITRLRDLLLKSQVKNFVPKISFFNTKGELVRFGDYFGNKPSIFHIARTWTGERYDLDKKTRENPNLSFIMVMEGNNFREWSEYLKAAEPVADQLLLKNDTISLRDIFIRNQDFYIIYDKSGNLRGYDNDLDRAVTMAKNSLVSPQKGFTVEQLRLIIKILLSVLVVFSIVLLVWKWRERLQFRKEQQQRRLRELELTAIRSQMNPHFLFNCLNSVQNLIQQNRSHEANQYLADFAGLIRKVLKNSEKEEISLAEELETVKQYLSLEKLRFDFNFEITVDQGIDQQNTMIPSMLLQPFVENAIIHGLQHKTGDRELKINIVHVNNGLKISIEDNGIGCEASKTFATGKNGKGSKLMKERLDLLREKQGEKYNLEIIDINQEGLTGTRVEIFIPEEK